LIFALEKLFLIWSWQVIFWSGQVIFKYNYPIYPVVKLLNVELCFPIFYCPR